MKFAGRLVPDTLQSLSRTAEGALGQVKHDDKMKAHEADKQDG